MYREGQKMSWHDDGEPGLGRTVAALSLGSEAIMSFRPKLKGSKNLSPVLHLTLSHGVSCDYPGWHGSAKLRWCSVFDRETITTLSLQRRNVVALCGVGVNYAVLARFGVVSWVLVGIGIRREKRTCADDTGCDYYGWEGDTEQVSSSCYTSRPASCCYCSSYFISHEPTTTPRGLVASWWRSGV